MAKKDTAFEAPCDFGGVNFGNETCRISLSISRDNISPDRMDDLFCYRRLRAKLFLGNDEGALIEKGLVVDVIGDTKGYGGKSKAFSTGLTMMLRDVDTKALPQFAKGQGKIVVETSEALPDENDEEGDDESDE